MAAAHAIPAVNRMQCPALILAVTLVTPLAAAVHRLGPEITEVDGARLGVAPGDVIELAAGERPRLEFTNLKGERGRPIVIRNAGGRVRVGSTEARAAVRFSGCSFFQLRGDGVPGEPLGIEVITARPEGGVGVLVDDFSTDFELCHLEVHDTGFAGIMAKTDPRCDGSAGRDRFVQRDTRIHHNFIHDVGGEGLYIGHSFYSGWKHDCDRDPATPPVVHHPHELVGVRIHENRIERTGWDGLQVGSATGDCEIADNVIKATGLRQVRYQQNGIQLGEGTTGWCTGNSITSAGSHGIAVLGQGTIEIAGNIIRRPGAYGVFCDNRPDTHPGSTVDIQGNTIELAAKGALLDYNEISRVTFTRNRIVLAPGTAAVETGSGAEPIVADNEVHP